MENEILQQILSKLTSMESDIKELKHGQANLENAVKEIKHGQFKLEQKVDKLEVKVDKGLVQQKENTEFIKAIKHATEENNAKLDGVSLTLAKVEGDTTAIAKKLNTLEAVTADNWGEINRLKAVK